jgi:hypothetical protein
MGPLLHSLMFRAQLPSGLRGLEAGERGMEELDQLSAGWSLRVSWCTVFWGATTVRTFNSQQVPIRQ